MKKKAKNYEGISPHDFKKSMLSVGVATALMSGGVCAQSEAIELLPDNRQLLQKINRYGMSAL